MLDTWFSSALWPFATLGWPEETPKLKTFYPTTVLSTARDIIYLWVARMIMMGLEFMGDVPFKDVIIHPDRAGRRRPAHEQEPGHRRRPAGAHRRLRRRRHPLRPGLHELRAGRALQRRAHRDGPQLRQQDLERLAPGAAGRPSRGRAAGGAGHPGRPLDLQPAGGGHARRSPASTRATSSTTWPGCSTASSGTRSATGTWRWPRPASTATTRASACR